MSAVSEGPYIEVCEPFSVVVTSEPTALSLEVSGELDGETWPTLERALLSCLVIAGDHVTVDVTGVSFVSVAACRGLQHALSTLVSAQRHVTVKPSRSLTRVVGLLDTLGVLPADAVSLMSA